VKINYQHCIKVFLLSTLLALSGLIFGQNTSAPEKFNFKIKRVLKHKEGDVYFVAQRDWRTYFVKADYTDNRLVLLYDLPMQSKEKEDINFIDAVAFDDKVIFLAYIFNKDKKEDRLYAMTIDLDGKTNGNWKRLDKSKAKKGFSYKIIKSKHANEFLVEKLYFNDSKGPKEVGYMMFDADLNVSYNLNFTLDVEHKYFSIKDHYISKNGRIFIIGMYDHEKEVVKEREIQKSGYMIYSFNPKSKDKVQMNKIDFAPKGRYVSEPFMYENDKGELFITGGYGQTHEYDGVSGIFMGSIDPESNTANITSLKRFSKSFITLFSDVQVFLINQYVPGMSSILYFHIDQEGNKYYVGGERFLNVVTTRTPTANGGSTSSTTYYYKNRNYYCLKFSKDNQFEWGRFIPLDIYSIDDGDRSSRTNMSITGDKSGVVVKFNNGTINIIFPYMKINKDNYYSGAIGGSKVQMVHAKVTPNGELNYNTFITGQEAKLVPFNKFTTFVEPSKILLFGQSLEKKKAYSILYLDL
jgi:hypothetical protein